ncbi:MAG TPA: tetratricopeptide repeat protein [Burkholderiales bacterium]|nr:tetratricopeptide repeat protein [Burkholderiales bacterium]
MRLPIRLVSLLLLACMPALPAGAAVTDEDIEDALRNPALGLYKGYAEFKMGRYADARRVWEALAAKGNGEAYFNLGILAEDGLGTPQDMQQALRLYEQAARGGSRAAQYRLGLVYSTGGRVAKDPQKAEHWLTLAAQQGDTDAARRLEQLRGSAETPFDRARRIEAEGSYAEAAALYRELSDAGNFRATTRLAWMHEAGRGLPKDLALAARLFRDAAGKGDPEAQYALAVMLATGAGQEKDEREARAWLEKSAAAGYPEAAKALAASPPR